MFGHSFADDPGLFKECDTKHIYICDKQLEGKCDEKPCRNIHNFTGGLPYLWQVLILVAPPLICSRRQFQVLPIFQKLQIRHDIHKNRLLAEDFHEISHLIFFEN